MTAIFPGGSPRTYTRSLCWLTAGFFILACTPSDAEPLSVMEAGGRKVVINDASRVVSIGRAITEILYAIDRDKQMVAVDATSTPA